MQGAAVTFAAALSNNAGASGIPGHTNIALMTNTSPSVCLAAWPQPQTLEGRLIGIYYKAVPQENPPIPARVSMYLELDKPISTCAATDAWTASYMNVTRVGLGWASEADYRFIMLRWGKRPIVITGNFLQSGMGSGGQSGPLVFWDISTFCSGSNNSSSFKCIPWDAWTSMILKDGRPHMCAGGKPTRPGSRNWVTNNPNGLGYTPFAIAHGAIGHYSTGQSSIAIFPSAAVESKAATVLYHSRFYSSEPTILAFLQKVTNLLPPLTNSTPLCSTQINTILNFE